MIKSLMVSKAGQSKFRSTHRRLEACPLELKIGVSSQANPTADKNADAAFSMSAVRDFVSSTTIDNVETFIVGGVVGFQTLSDVILHFCWRTRKLAAALSAKTKSITVTWVVVVFPRLWCPTWLLEKSSALSYDLGARLEEKALPIRSPVSSCSSASFSLSTFNGKTPGLNSKIVV